MNALERLENWLATGSKWRCANMEIGNGFGATCWEVNLYGKDHQRVHAVEVSFFEYEPEDVPENVVIAFPEDGDWPGPFHPGNLERTLHAALDRAEKLGL